MPEYRFQLLQFPLIRPLLSVSECKAMEVRRLAIGTLMMFCLEKACRDEVFKLGGLALFISCAKLADRELRQSGMGWMMDDG